MANAQTFAAELAQEHTKLLAEIDRQQRALAILAFTRIVQRTPVDTGRARMSWHLSRGTPDDSVPPEGSYPLGAAMAQATALAPSVRLEPIHISSNLHYIADLEAGTSKQAPAGMVGLTLAELQTLGGLR